VHQTVSLALAAASSCGQGHRFGPHAAVTQNLRRRGGTARVRSRAKTLREVPIRQQTRLSCSAARGQRPLRV
jgi:hypothetical protein